MRQIKITIETTSCAKVLAPSGITTPFESVVGLDVSGGQIKQVLREPDLDLSASLITVDADQVVLTYHVDTAPAGATYPERAFAPRQNKYTRAAPDLAEAARKIVKHTGGGRAGIEALVHETQSLFSYAHPERRFNDGTEVVPYLSSGLTPGSCVDINTYLVASLRAAGYQAAYIYGYFFPQEKGGAAQDGHCWVVTRHEGEVLEWDIAHHIKAGLGPTQAALNPRPGHRIGISHSMGHSYFGLDMPLIKVLGEPLPLDADLVPVDAALSVNLASFE